MSSSSLGTMAVFHFSLNVVSYLIKGWFIQLFSLFATILIVYSSNMMRTADNIRIPRIIWRSFYPLHLMVLAIILSFTGNPS
ncbi:hypothetical protein FHS15_003279 [Paenibacillus castaneae]|uniref:hypothetical protein n=1 Tax=Paenibacillus castaneae TaxID=474957 RepID=UPI0011AEECFA|nr:hypothetical protein [Paenibacillus castaneae]NIK78141.1 hypothetical protein [Paenibacillus castaneae]